MVQVIGDTLIFTVSSFSNTSEETKKLKTLSKTIVNYNIVVLDTNGFPVYTSKKSEKE